MPDDKLFEICCWIYLALGVLVAWYRMRQEKMDLLAPQSNTMVFILAMMWPMLLFPMRLGPADARSNELNEGPREDD